MYWDSFWHLFWSSRYMLLPPRHQREHSTTTTISSTWGAAAQCWDGNDSLDWPAAVRQLCRCHTAWIKILGFSDQSLKTKLQAFSARVRINLLYFIRVWWRAIWWKITLLTYQTPNAGSGSGSQIGCPVWKIDSCQSLQNKGWLQWSEKWDQPSPL